MWLTLNDISNYLPFDYYVAAVSIFSIHKLLLWLDWSRGTGNQFGYRFWCWWELIFCTTTCQPLVNHLSNTHTNKKKTLTNTKTCTQTSSPCPETNLTITVAYGWKRLILLLHVRALAWKKIHCDFLNAVSLDTNIEYAKGFCGTFVTSASVNIKT